MPGKIHLGIDSITPGAQSMKTKVARAYCEGRFAESIAAPQVSNPFPDNKSETFIAWDQGWSDHLAGTPSARETGCAV